MDHNMKHRLATIGAVAILTAASACAALAQDQGKAAVTGRQAEVLSEQKLREIARDAYKYAYPIVLMDMTMRQSTAVSNATSVHGRAPLNQFAYFRTYPAADARDVVRFNFDTLYSFAWADLSKGPLILSVPDTDGRYYLVPSLDMWTDVFASVGSRTTGTAAGNFAYVPPGWQGSLPEGVPRIDAPTSMIWIMGRVQTNGPADYDNVHNIQDGLKLTPLDQWGKSYMPPATSSVDASVDTKTPPLVQVEKLTGVEFFTRFAELLKKYPPHPNDYPILFRMRALGLYPAQSWDASKLDVKTTALINDAAKAALGDIVNYLKRGGSGMHVNGWNIATDNMGTYGTSYLQRALVALAGLGANLPADAVYPAAFVDSEGKPLNGANKYVLHFNKDQLPPVDAFWSLTMYDEQGYQVPNPINRFAIGDRDRLKFNADGSLDIYIQHGAPSADKEANWLPSPASGALQPTLRLYSPRSSVTEGTWVPPGIKRAD